MKYRVTSSIRQSAMDQDFATIEEALSYIKACLGQGLDCTIVNL